MKRVKSFTDFIYVVAPKVKKNYLVKNMLIAKFHISVNRIPYVVCAHL